MICYKVLRSDLGSAVLHPTNPYYIQYIIGEWVEPMIGKIFVFDSLKSAKKFQTSIWLAPKIFKADADELEIIKTVSSYSFFGIITRFWSGAKVQRCPPPTGTRFCNRLKLIEEVT